MTDVQAQARAPTQLPTTQHVRGISHPSGCPTTCRASHLTAVALDRLVKSGIDIATVRAALDDEAFSHEPRARQVGLSPQGRLNLVTWGATPEEQTQIGEMDAAGQPEPQRLSFHERERRRVERYRAGLDPATKRARDAEAARRYRQRQRQRDQETGQGDA